MRWLSATCVAGSLVVLGASCAAPLPTPQLDRGIVQQPVPIDLLSDTSGAIERKLVDNTWVSPGTVNVGNFYPGARAEWPVRVHNGNDAKVVTDKWQVTTDLGEMQASMRLKSPLAGADIAKVTSLVSDNPKDTLRVVSYDAKTRGLLLSGFAGNSARLLQVSYLAWQEMSVRYRSPDRPKEGYSPPPSEAQDWVIIADNTPVLAPKETREILVALDMPKGARAPKKWSFWIVVSERSDAMISAEMASTWLVDMR